MTPEEALREVQDPALSREERIARAAYLSDFADRIRRALEPLRDELRLEAEARTEDTITFEGRGMTRATLSKSVPSIELNPGVSIADLKAILEERFDDLFTVTERVHARKATRMLLRKLPRDLRDRVFSVLRPRDNAARISFQYGGSLLTMGEEEKP